jgi:hypothetical protein
MFQNFSGIKQCTFVTTLFQDCFRLVSLRRRNNPRYGMGTLDYCLGHTCMIPSGKLQKVTAEQLLLEQPVQYAICSFQNSTNNSPCLTIFSCQAGLYADQGPSSIFPPLWEQLRGRESTYNANHASDVLTLYCSHARIQLADFFPCSFVTIGTFSIPYLSRCLLCTSHTVFTCMYNVHIS